MTQSSLIMTLPLIHSTLEIGQVFLGCLDSLSFVFDCYVHHSAWDLDGHGSHLLGAVDAQAASFDHGGTAYSYTRVGCGDDHVAASKQDGVASEAEACIDSNHRHLSVQSAQQSP